MKEQIKRIRNRLKTIYDQLGKDLSDVDEAIKDLENIKG